MWFSLCKGDEITSRRLVPTFGICCVKLTCDQHGLFEMFFFRRLYEKNSFCNVGLREFYACWIRKVDL